MKTRMLAIGVAAALLVLSGCVATARDDRPRYARFDDRDEQVTRTWYHHHRDNPPAGLRIEDRLSADEESRLREGAVLDERLRGKMHEAPGELTRQLRPPPRNHRYVMIGGHIGLIDNKNEVKSVIRVYENQ